MPHPAPRQARAHPKTLCGHNERTPTPAGGTGRGIGRGNRAPSKQFSTTALRGPETYAYTAKRYTFPYMEFDLEKLEERVRVGVGVRGLLKRNIQLKFPLGWGIRASTQPTPVARSKTPLRPLREALRIRMERSGWESAYLFGRPLAICLPHTPKGKGDPIRDRPLIRSRDPRSGSRVNRCCSPQLVGRNHTDKAGCRIRGDRRRAVTGRCTGVRPGATKRVGDLYLERCCAACPAHDDVRAIGRD